jgi:hypothetical protein
VAGGNAGMIITTVLTFGFAALATIALLWPGFGTSSPDAALPSGFTRTSFELWQFIPLLVLIGLGVLFYALGSNTRNKTVALKPGEHGTAEAIPDGVVTG